MLLDPIPSQVDTELSGTTTITASNRVE